MNRLIRYFNERSFLVNLLSVFFLIGGAVTFSVLQTDMMPEATRPTLAVTGSMPGASALQVERYAARKLEQQLQSVAGVELMEARVSNGSFSIDLNFNASTVDMQASKDEVERILQSVEPSLPDVLEDLQVSDRNRRSGWMGSLSILGLDPDSAGARLVTESVTQRIQGIKGIVSINSELQLRRLIVRLKEDVLAKSNLQSEQILASLRTHLLPKFGGSVEKDAERINIEVVDPPLDLEYLSQLPVVSTSLGKTFRLEDVADLEWRYTSSPTLRKLNGQTYTRFWIFKDYNTDILDLEESVLAEIESINEGLLATTPYVLQASRLASEFVRTQLGTLQNNALLGLILVVLLLGYFLGIRSALVTAFSVPLAYAFTLMMFTFLGMTINIVSLVGLILVLGLLVDDAIIVSEKYSQNLEAGMKPFDAAQASAQQLLRPVTATIVTSVIAFMPILAVEGFLKEIFSAVPIVLAAALFASWFESFFVLPNHLRDFVKKPSRERVAIVKLREFYTKTLKITLKWRYGVLVFLAALTAVSVWLGTQKIKTQFFIRFGGESIELSAHLKDSSSVEFTEEKLKPIEDFMYSLKETFPEISEVSYRIGRVWVERQRKTHPRFAEFDVDIESSASNLSEVKRNVEKKINTFIGAYDQKDEFERLSVSRRFSRSDTNLDEILSVQFRGQSSFEFDQLRRTTEDFAKDLKGYVSFSYDEDTLTESWVFDPDLERLNDLKLDISDLTSQLRLRTANRNVGNAYFGDEEIEVYASIGDFENSPEFEKLQKIQIIGAQNILIPITDLGSWRQRKSFDSIYREDGARALNFDLKFDSNVTDSGKFQKEVEEKLLPKLEEAFPGYEVVTKLGNPEEEENRSSMLQISLMCVIGILFVLALQLGSITQPFLVASVIPFGVFGALWALYFHGMDLGLMAMVGLLGVAGVAVNDSIVMVDQCNIYRKEREEDGGFDYILKGASSRLRAIMLTTLTTLGGLFPMAYGLGGDSALTRPIAFSMSWGLLGSTLLTLLALPAFLAMRDDVLRLTSRVMKKIRK